MEDELDDACCIIQYAYGRREDKDSGTRIKDSDIIVSKSSMVHGTLNDDFEERGLKVISRIEKTTWSS